MKSSLLLATACSLAFAIPSMASAATVLDYKITGSGGTSDYKFNFKLDTGRAPTFQVPNNVTRFSPTQITFTRPGNSTPIVTDDVFNGAGPSFFTSFQQGGIALLRLPAGGDRQIRFFGPQLFDGTTANPIFKTGTFALTTEPLNGGGQIDNRLFNYSITVSPLAVNSAVPEPSTWALIILGFFGSGAALRFRRNPKRRGMAVA